MRRCNFCGQTFHESKLTRIEFPAHGLLLDICATCEVDRLPDPGEDAERYES